MPQTLSPEWEAELGANAAEIHAKWKHRVGNLTLTGYNSELSNSPFATKRELLQTSGLQMNREIAALPTWTENDMEKRADRLADLAVEIWPGPVRVGAA